MVTIHRENNFDLIRLIAALQVAVYHGAEHFNLKGKSSFFDAFISFISYFPGVPIFFFISGFLIYASYNRNKNDWYKYAKNRLLRIYPALIVCSIFLVIVLLIEGVSCSLSKFSMYFLGQITLFQFWTPDCLRLWGVGTPNGSLWTIAVELQFYLFIPLFGLFVKKVEKLNAKFILLTFFVLSYGFSLWHQNMPSELLYVKVIGVSLFPYLFFFILGMFCFEYWSKIEKLIQGKAFYYFLVYVLFCWIFSYQLALFNPSYSPNFIGLCSILLLLACVVSFAFTNQSLSEKMLKGNDISYGVYIYHMIVVNLFVQHIHDFRFVHLIYVIIVTVITAYFSWRFVEKKALLIK